MTQRALANTFVVLVSLGLWISSGIAGAATPPATSTPLTVNGIRSKPLAAASRRASGTLFETLTPAQTGIDFVHRWAPEPRYERLFNSSLVGGGVAAGDYDGDGLVDLCLTRPSGGPRLYRNLGGCRFTNVTDQAGVRNDSGWTTGVSFIDVNGDGALDLYICCYDGANRLYINQGNGTFTEQAKARGLDFRGASMMMAFGDYDRDGKLDGYLLTAGLIPNPSQAFRVKFVNGRPEVLEHLREFYQIMYLPEERAVVAEAGQLDHLYHQEAGGTFRDVSKEAGISGFDIGNAVIWWDYNADGWPDLYVANDYFGPDHLYRNDHNGKFTDVTGTALPHTPWTSMGADAGDLNNDGLIDLITSDMSGSTRYQRMIDMIDYERSGWFLEWAEPRQYMRNAVFFNTGKDRFLEAAYLNGMADTDWTWSILLADLDNDGRLDVFVPNGMTRDWMDADLAAQAKALPPEQFAKFWQGQPKRADMNLAFQNQGDLRFASVGKAWGLEHPGPSFGAVAVDLDNDGNLDLVINDFDGPPRVCRNNSSGQHRVVVRLAGANGNRFGIGATVRVESPGGKQMRSITLAHGFMSAGEPAAHFGLGNDARISRLTVEWPSGAVSEFRDLPADQAFTVSEPPPPATAAEPETPPSTLFKRVGCLAAAVHAEAPFDDWARQPLLPWKLSQAGPGLAWADVDGNGRDDLYLAGSLTKPGQLHLNEGQGRFRAGVPLPGAVPREEMAPLFFEVNGDGFPDLLIVSGGARAEQGSEALRHQLFLNDGKGGFVLAPTNTLPDLRDGGSVAAAGDFDRDGAVDLFIGARCSPGKYPQTSSSRLLRNQQGRFVEVTDSVAPGLRQAGLVTSAIWSDVDGDGWLDLLVTCEWGPVRLFVNEGGRLVERTREAGLAEHLGWWRGIAAGDIDNDGDIDYVVSNLGLNTRYRPTAEEPCLLYYGDFAGNGDPQIIEATVNAQGVFPMRGLGPFEKVLPNVREKFPTHHRFAAATLPDLVGTQALNAASKLTVNTSESCILRNNGHGVFSFEPLPRLAQIAPIHGVAFADIDGDGNLDLLAAQNFYSPQRETGRMDGGVSLLLMGNGRGSFSPVWPDLSGIMVPADARSLATCDLNGDGWVDFVVGVNNGPVYAFQNSVPKTNRMFAVKLQGRRDNPTAAGSRVSVHLKHGGMRTAEVYAGGGYLSQSDSTLRFGLGTTGEVEKVEVRWPRGQSSTHPAPLQGNPVVLREE